MVLPPLVQLGARDPATEPAPTEEKILDEDDLGTELPARQRIPREWVPRIVARGYVTADGNCLFASFAHLLKYHGMESTLDFSLGSLQKDDGSEYAAAVRIRQKVYNYFRTRVAQFNQEWHYDEARQELSNQKALTKNATNPDFVNLDLDNPSILNMLTSYGQLVMRQDREYSSNVEIDIAANLFNVIIDRYNVPLLNQYMQYGRLTAGGDVPWGAATFDQSFAPEGQTTNTKRWAIIWKGRHFWWVPTDLHDPGTSYSDGGGSGKKNKTNPLPFTPAPAPVPSPPSLPPPPVVPYVVSKGGGKRPSPPDVVKGDSRIDGYDPLFTHAYSTEWRKMKDPQPTWAETLDKQGLQPNKGSDLRSLADEYRANPTSWPLERLAVEPTTPPGAAGASEGA